MEKKGQMNTKIQVRSIGSLSDLEKNIQKITFTNKKWTEFNTKRVGIIQFATISNKMHKSWLECEGIVKKYINGKKKLPKVIIRQRRQMENNIQQGFLLYSRIYVMVVQQC
jgi:hypothetical protein